MKMHVSKAYRCDKHIGFKKTIAKRAWFLIYGTTAACEAKAIAIATACEAKWQLLKLSGRTEFTDSDFEEAKRIAMGQPDVAETSPPPPADTLRHVIALNTTGVGGSTTTSQAPRRWLH